MTTENMINLHARMLPIQQELTNRPPDHQSDAHLTEPLRQAAAFVIGASMVKLLKRSVKNYWWTSYLMGSQPSPSASIVVNKIHTYLFSLHGGFHLIYGSFWPTHKSQIKPIMKQRSEVHSGTDTYDRISLVNVARCVIV